MAVGFFSRRGPVTTKNKLVLHVSNPRSAADQQAVDVLTEIDPTVGVRSLIPGYDEDKASPVLDAIPYDLGVYHGTMGILGFVEQVHKDQADAKLMYVVLAALRFDGSVISEGEYKNRLQAVQASCTDLLPQFPITPDGLEETIWKAASRGDLLDNRTGLGLGLTITPRGKETLEALRTFVAESTEGRQLA